MDNNQDKKNVTEGGMYSVYDRTAEQFSPVFECKNDGMAVRQVRDSFNKQVYDDYRLYRVGRTIRADGYIMFEQTADPALIEIPAPRKEVKE